MIQIHGKTTLSEEFKSIIKTHDLIMANYLSKSPVFTGDIKKTQFSLATSKSLVLTTSKSPVLTGGKKKKKNPILTFLIGNIKKPNFH